MVACIVELGILLVAAVSSLVFRVGLLGSIKLSAPDALVGVVAAAPLFVLFIFVLNARSGPLGEIRLFLDTVMRTAFSSWTLLDIALVSILAGLAEESLFRGVIQAGLESEIGKPFALLFASAIFGLCHAVNRPYAVVAGGIGLYLGVIFSATGNLLAPIVTHALYDFVALFYFLRVHRTHQHAESE